MRSLLQTLKVFYKKEGRAHLPWRRTRDPYRILVSEIMLQQTQVDRVIPFYKNFIKQFPTAQALSRAPLSKVLTAWQGLGYNRRAKFLHEAAKIIAREGFTGQRLPGVGPYTAGAVAAFAFNQPKVFVETNIRTVFFYYGFVSKNSMTDQELLPLVADTLRRSRMEPRDFYAALMDYGSHLKRKGVQLNAYSAHYTKQSRFEGSARQLRGTMLRTLLKSPATKTQLIKNLSRNSGEVDRELQSLQADGLIVARGRYFDIAP